MLPGIVFDLMYSRKPDMSATLSLSSSFGVNIAFEHADNLPEFLMLCEFTHVPHSVDVVSIHTFLSAISN